MKPHWALAVVAVIAFMASLGTLIPLFADLAGEPLARWQRRRRVFVASLLLIGGTLIGAAAYKASISTDTGTTTQTGVTDTGTTETSKTGSTVTKAEPEPDPDPPPPPVPKPRPSIVITDARGRSVPQLVAVAQRLAKRGYIVNGTFSEESEKSTEFQDMYTVFVSLDVTVLRNDAIVSTFVVSTRGGGFRTADARQQAMERLSAGFEEKLAREIP